MVFTYSNILQEKLMETSFHNFYSVLNKNIQNLKESFYVRSKLKLLKHKDTDKKEGEWLVLYRPKTKPIINYHIKKCHSTSCVVALMCIKIQLKNEAIRCRFSNIAFLSSCPCQMYLPITRGTSRSSATTIRI